jgi:hypothetical protein
MLNSELQRLAIGLQGFFGIPNNKDDTKRGIDKPKSSDAHKNDPQYEDR